MLRSSKTSSSLLPSKTHSASDVTRYVHYTEILLSIITGVAIDVNIPLTKVSPAVNKSNHFCRILMIAYTLECFRGIRGGVDCPAPRWNMEPGFRGIGLVSLQTFISPVDSTDRQK